MGRSGSVRDGSHAEVPHPQGVRDLKRERAELARKLFEDKALGAERRQTLGALVTTRLAEHYDEIAWDVPGIALAAVGSLGRGESGPHSDLDLVLLHDGTSAAKARVGDIANALWYPLWDAGIQLDHSTRSLVECRQVADKDLAAAAGLIDLKPIAGDAQLAQQARSAILADWRSAARQRLPELLAASRARAERSGEVAYLLEPNIKDSRGGLRDLVSLAALAATWLTDRPRGAVDAAGEHLYDVRDAMHMVAGRATNVLGRHMADEVAELLGMADSDDLLASLAEAGRTVAYALDTTERGARRSLERSGVGSRAFLARRRKAAPRHVYVGQGLIDVDGELALAPDYQAEEDAILPLRAAAIAAQTGLTFTPSLLEAFARCPDLPVPWPQEARDHLNDLLRGSAHLVAVWEAIDLAGQAVRWLPEWAGVRNRPQRNPFHLFTVDRHMVEAVAIAGRGKRHVPGLDLVLVAAWLHDIGKRPGGADHSEAGARMIPAIMARIGAPEDFAADVELLVRHHLTLAELATTKDIEDPATIATLLDALQHRPELLEALRALTEADARAAGPKAWTAWRESLIESLTVRARAALQAGAAEQGRR